MSRVGKQQISLPEKVECSMASGVLTIKGPLGTLSREFKSDIEIVCADGVVTFTPKRNDVDTKALWGTYASHVGNMVEGVSKGYEKKLIIEGVGYRAALSGAKLTLNLGFSHPVDMPIPEGLKVAVDKNVLTITGIDKELVGAFASQIRALRKPEPYKGKGIRYDGEIIRRKEGKKVVS